MTVTLFCPYAFIRNLLDFQQNKFEDFYSAIQLNVFQLSWVLLWAGFIGCQI